MVAVPPEFSNKLAAGVALCDVGGVDNPIISDGLQNTSWVCGAGLTSDTDINGTLGKTEKFIKHKASSSTEKDKYI